MFYHQYVQHLAILGLCEGATVDEVKSAYRTLAMQWHPDRFETRPGEQAEAEERMKRINAAYDWLMTNPHAFEGKPKTEADVEEEKHSVQQPSSRPKSGCAPYLWVLLANVVIRGIAEGSGSDATTIIFAVLLLIGVVIFITQNSSTTDS